jgi:hypothetical protein
MKSSFESKRISRDSQTAIINLIYDPVAEKIKSSGLRDSRILDFVQLMMQLCKFAVIATREMYGFSG